MLTCVLRGDFPQTLGGKVLPANLIFILTSGKRFDERVQKYTAYWSRAAVPWLKKKRRAMVAGKVQSGLSKVHFKAVRKQLISEARMSLHSQRLRSPRKED